MKEAFVYKWTNLTTGSYYIGYHKGDTQDGYVCSSKSKRFWDDFKNPSMKWVRDILFEGTSEECVAEELRLLKSLDLKNDKVYNNSAGGGIIFSSDVRQKMSKSHNGRTKGDGNPMFGQHHKIETRNKIANSRKGKGRQPKSLEHRKRIAEAMKGNTNTKGKTWTLK